MTGFNVYQGTSPGHESATPVNPSRVWATAKGYTVSGLTNGTKYYFKVRALNPAGLGAPSHEVSVTPAQAPTVPRSLSATSGKESVALTWQAPASNGGRPVNGYNVYVGTAAGGESLIPVNPSRLGGSATGYTVKGLTDGTKYFFTVRAINAVAVGAASFEKSATPKTVPHTPTYLHAYSGKGTARLTWVAPEDTGGSPLTGFNVYKGTVSGGESTTPVNASPVSKIATSYTVTGLTNGTKYYFKVKAINAVGLSAALNQASATPTAASRPPGPPIDLAADAASHSAHLTWSAPSSTGGTPITGYNVYEGTVANLESAVPVNGSPLSPNARSYLVTGLTNSSQYYFTVQAVNAIGKGAPSNEAFAIPAANATVPAAPTNLQATVVSANVKVTWVAPPWDGGRAITGYNVYKGTAAGGESNVPVNPSPLSPSATSYTVTGLTHGTRYYFTIKAINPIGPSTASNEANAKP